MVRVLIADDHATVREGLRRILESQPGLEVVAEAADARELRLRAAEASPDVVVLDYNIPGSKGFGLLRELREARPGVAVLVLSMHPEEELGVAALRAGAAGYVGKEAAAEALVAAIRKVGAGGRYISPRLADKVALGVALGGAERPEALSARELEILRLIASGAAPKEICFKLGISRNTVATYRVRLLRKLGLRGNADLVRYALEQGLLE